LAAGHAKRPEEKAKGPVAAMLRSCYIFAEPKPGKKSLGPAALRERRPGRKTNMISMTSKFASIAVAVLGLIGAGRCGAAEDELDAATKARIAEYDKGPTKIDVSAYPQGVQKNYEVFRQKCTLCHALSRPINCDFALADEWSRYVKRMMHKPGSMISPDQAKRIYSFLVYDSSIRKKAMLEAKLAQLKPEEKVEAEKLLKAVHDEYDQK
jgi:cytochrome c5